MPYPTKSEILSLLDSIENGDGSAFWAQVAPDVDWIVMGTHPGAGHYRSLDDLLKNTFHRLLPFMEGGVKLNVRSVLVDGDWSTVELEGRGTRKNGLPFYNTLAMMMRWSEAGKVVEVRDYLDSSLIKEVFAENGVTEGGPGFVV